MILCALLFYIGFYQFLDENKIDFINIVNFKECLKRNSRSNPNNSLHKIIGVTPTFNKGNSLVCYLGYFLGVLLTFRLVNNK